MKLLHEMHYNDSNVEDEIWVLVNIGKLSQGLGDISLLNYLTQKHFWTDLIFFFIFIFFFN